MGQISINLTDNDKLTLKKEAKKQKKSLSEFCRERILNPHKQIPSEKSTDFIHSADIDKKLTTLNKNLIVLFNEIKALQQNQLEMRKQVYYNSSYLYFLTHELFADNPEIAHKIDEKIKNLNFNYDNSSADKNSIISKDNAIFIINALFIFICLLQVRYLIYSL